MVLMSGQEKVWDVSVIFIFMIMIRIIYIKKYDYVEVAIRKPVIGWEFVLIVYLSKFLYGYE